MKKKWLPLATMLLAAPGLQAEAPQLHGFASQGLLVSDGNSFYGSSEGGTWRLREVGLNLSYRPAPRLLLSAQGLLRQAGEHDLPPATVDYLFMGLTLSSTLDRQDDLLVGRIKLPLGFYNETRDVPVTRPSIFLPQSIYFDRTRDLALSADGLLWVGRRHAFGGDWTFKLGALRPRLDTAGVEAVLFDQDLPGTGSAGLMVTSHLLFEDQRRGLRLALSGLRAEARYAASAVLPSGRVRFLPVILSAALDRERWSLTGEYARRPIRYDGFRGSRFEDLAMNGESYYLQGTWRLTPRLELLARHDRLVVDADDPDGSAFAAANGLPAHLRFATDRTLGLSWQATKSWRLQVERHWIDGTAWLTPTDRARGPLSRRWGLWAMMVAYRF